MRSFIFSMLIVFSFVPVALADTDEGLYAPAVPEGSAFIRFFNMDEAPVTVSVNGQTYGDASPSTVTPYYVVIKGDLNITVGDQVIEDQIDEGEYFTLIQKGEAALFIDYPNENRAKATVSLYNLSDEQAVDLKAKQESVTVLEYVEAGQNTARDINPMKIDFSVTREGKSSIPLEPVILERGNHYSVFFDGKTSFIEQAKIDTTR